MRRARSRLEVPTLPMTWAQKGREKSVLARLAMWADGETMGCNFKPAVRRFTSGRKCPRCPLAAAGTALRGRYGALECGVVWGSPRAATRYSCTWKLAEDTVGNMRTALCTPVQLASFQV